MDELKVIESEVRSALKGVKTRTGAVNALKKHGFKVNDVSDESGYANLRVPTPDGAYVRAYKTDGMDSFKVQKFTFVTFRWSGVPVFEPSGKSSF